MRGIVASRHHGIKAEGKGIVASRHHGIEVGRGRVPLRHHGTKARGKGIDPYLENMMATNYSPPSIRSFRDLVAWQKAFSFGMTVYRIVAMLPNHERFGLTDELRRGAPSVASNIAEGYGRGSRADYVRFLKIARGALYELDTQLLFSVELTYISTTVYDAAKMELDECERILAGLIRSLDRRPKPPRS